MEIWFGKHKGWEVAALPTSYLRWLVTDFDVAQLHPGEIRGTSPGYQKFLLDRRRELVAEAEDVLIERGEAK